MAPATAILAQLADTPNAFGPESRQQEHESAAAAKKQPAKKATGVTKSRRSTAGGSSVSDALEPKRTRRTPLFPAGTFEDALELATSIFEFGSGQPVRRITLFDSLGKSPDSGSTRQLVTNSAKYGLTIGSYAAEQLALTPDGRTAVADDVSSAARARARYKLAVENVEVFKHLYDAYLGNRLPAQAVLADKAREFGVPDSDVAECIETFTVNTKFVGVLRSISGAERLVSIDTFVDDYLPEAHRDEDRPHPTSTPGLLPAVPVKPRPGSDNECFYITPIGDEGSEERKHSDLFMGTLIEPVLGEFGLNLVRADKIGEAGMITGQIIEHIFYSK